MKLHRSILESKYMYTAFPYIMHTSLPTGSPLLQSVVRWQWTVCSTWGCRLSLCRCHCATRTQSEPHPHHPSSPHCIPDPGGKGKGCSHEWMLTNLTSLQCRPPPSRKERGLVTLKLFLCSTSSAVSVRPQLSTMFFWTVLCSTDMHITVKELWGVAWLWG